MDKRTALILIVALSCPGRSVAQSVRNYDDTGAPPFKVLKEGGGWFGEITSAALLIAKSCSRRSRSPKQYCVIMFGAEDTSTA